MKKILIAVILSSIFIGNVYAFTNDLNITKSNYYVCDGNNNYPIYLIKQNDFNYYFLNMNKNHNFDFRDYLETEFNNTNINERVRAFTSYESMFLASPNFDELYEPFVSLMIYRYLNNNDNLYLCDKDSNIVDVHSSYEKNYQRIKDIIDGPDFDNPIRIIPNKEYSLTDPNLSFYNFENIDNLDAFIPDSNTIIINGDKGQYEINFQYNNYGTLGNIYTDNNDYLLKEGIPKNENFHFTVLIDDPILHINNYSEEDIDFNSLCFNLTKDNETYSFCSDSEGLASIKVPVGIYKLVILSDINNDYALSHIAINNVDEYLTINWGSNVTPNEDNNVGFIPSDTLELSGLIITLITALGIVFVIKKTF